MLEQGSYKRITGAHIKWLAIISMLIDHMGVALIEPTLWTNIEVMYTDPKIHRLYILYMIMRGIGRFAFPAFGFLLVEGFCHTRSKARYLRNMLLFMVISEIPFDLVISGEWWDTAQQNVFFTLGFGLIAIWIVDTLHKQMMINSQYEVVYGIISLAAVTGIACCAEWLHTDYGWLGVTAIFLLYLLRKTPVWGILAAGILLSMVDWLEICCLSLIPVVACYNGERGRQPKYFFYVFYPLHLLILWMLGTAFFR